MKQHNATDVYAEHIAFNLNKKCTKIIILNLSQNRSRGVITVPLSQSLLEARTGACTCAARLTQHWEKGRGSGGR